MDINTIFLAALLFLIVAGVLIGIYFALSSGQKKRNQRRPAAGREGLVVVARLVRDKVTNMLMIVMDGDVYSKPSELTTAQRQRLTEAASDLQNWLGVAAEVPTSSSMPAEPVVSSEWVSDPKILAQENMPEVKPISTNPLEALRYNMGPSKPTPVFRSITAQINDILQAKLAGTELEKRRISLLESPNVGVIVQIGMDQYPGINEVPDLEVRKLIRSAVADWEAQHR